MHSFSGHKPLKTIQSDPIYAAPDRVCLAPDQGLTTRILGAKANGYPVLIASDGSRIHIYRSQARVRLLRRPVRHRGSYGSSLVRAGQLQAHCAMHAVQGCMLPRLQRQSRRCCGSEFLRPEATHREEFAKAPPANIGCSSLGGRRIGRAWRDAAQACSVGTEAPRAFDASASGVGKSPDSKRHSNVVFQQSAQDAKDRLVGRLTRARGLLGSIC